LGTRGDIITRADLAGERWPVRRAEDRCDAVDELVIVSCGSGAQIVELVRPIAAVPAAWRAALCGEPSGGRDLDDAVAIEHMAERRRPCR
jgi:hypothetical protein